MAALFIVLITVQNVVRMLPYCKKSQVNSRVTADPDRKYFSTVVGKLRAAVYKLQIAIVMHKPHSEKPAELLLKYN